MKTALVTITGLTGLALCAIGIAVHHNPMTIIIGIGAGILAYKLYKEN